LIETCVQDAIMIEIVDKFHFSQTEETTYHTEL
jgi:hypothetical protein